MAFAGLVIISANTRMSSLQGLKGGAHRIEYSCSLPCTSNFRIKTDDWDLHRQERRVSVLPGCHRFAPIGSSLMKLLSLLCVLVACVLAATGESQAQPKKEGPKVSPPDVIKDGIKYDMDYLEKTFSLKLKAVKLQQQRTEGVATLITMTLEFTKDSSKLLTGAFAGKAYGPSGGEGPSLLKCYFFDEDGVVFTKQPPGKIEGEVSFKAGDAFRVIQSVPNDVLAKTKKISFRNESPNQKK